MDKHLRAVNTLPGELPKIDFTVYKSRVAVSGMVDTFEKSYAGLQIPYPSDQVSIDFLYNNRFSGILKNHV